MEITLKNLPLPCLLNQMYRAIPIRVGKRTVMKNILSSKARKCREHLCWAITQQLRARPMINRPCILSCSFTPPDRRKRDADGYMKQLQDSLQAAGVVTDDSLFVNIHAEMMPTPKRPGWCDVTIQEIP